MDAKKSRTLTTWTGTARKWLGNHSKKIREIAMATAAKLKVETSGLDANLALLEAALKPLRRDGIRHSIGGKSVASIVGQNISDHLPHRQRGDRGGRARRRGRHRQGGAGSQGRIQGLAQARSRQAAGNPAQGCRHHRGACRRNRRAGKLRHRPGDPLHVEGRRARRARIFGSLPTACISRAMD